MAVIHLWDPNPTVMELCGTCGTYVVDENACCKALPEPQEAQ